MKEDPTNWRHAICDPCLERRYPGLVPARLTAPDEEVCCYCNYPTLSGAYVREDPKIVHPQPGHTVPADLPSFTAWATGAAQERVEVNLRLYDAWLLLGNVQLTCTYPGLASGLRDELRGLGSRLEALIAALAPPAIAALAAQGWDRSKNQEREADD